MLTHWEIFCIIVYVGLRKPNNIYIIWPLGQVVKTPPFHGGNRGSSPLEVTNTMWAHSSAGRASALQAEGHRFEPCCAHHIITA